MKTSYSKIGFIGGGRITRILLEAFRNKLVEFDELIVYEPDNKVSASLLKEYDNISLANSLSSPAYTEILFLAVHPPVMMEVLNQIKDVIGNDTVVVSLAPKITIEKIKSVLSVTTVLRMIPNASSYINDGYNPVTFCSGMEQSVKKGILDLFSVFGDTFEVAEDKLEAYAIVSAMLPTYFWFQWQKMQEIAIKCGLDDDESIEVIYRSMQKSVNMFYNADLTSEEIIDLIPVKPIREHETEIEGMLESKLLGLYEKIKP